MRWTFLLALVVSAYSFNFISTKKEPESIEELGEILFNDPILSGDYSVACSSCHNPAFAFADTTAFSVGVNKKLSSRNTPTVMNVLARPLFFWDGRAKTLEEQALHPIKNPDEMNLSLDEAVKRLNQNEDYVKWFKKFFNAAPDSNNLGEAIAAFEMTLETASTPFDDWADGNEDAISESAKRGRRLFNEKAGCFDCHFGPDFTGDEFRNIGLYNGKDLNDAGRFLITKDSNELGAFKVPGLRNVGLTAPYMHNGMFKSLNEVIRFYNNPDEFVNNSINRDTLMNKKLNLSDQEIQDLESFLLTLTDKSLVK